MKKIIAIIITIGIIIPKSFSQENAGVSKCDSLITEAKKQFGCGQAFWMRNMLMKQAADCYAENNEIEKAIELAEYYVRDVDEQYLGGQGWIEKLIEFQRKKNGDNYVKSQIAEVEVEIKINEFYFDITDTLTLTTGFEWTDIIEVTVELFGKEYWITSTIESQDGDNLISDEFILSRRNEEELRKYFDGRWRESLMYREIEKIK
jgi:hypothetical protein